MSVAKLNGQVAFVTGAAAGIGFAIARTFAEAGARVALTDVDETAAQAAAESLRNAGANCLALRCDVASTVEVDRAIAATIERLGKLDTVVNNAAVAISGDPALMPDADWNRVINTNLTSVFRVVRAALPHLRRAGGGSIINLASTQAHRSFGNWSAYAAAKGGILALTRQLAGQLGPDKIRVNSISPGAINTPMNASRVAREGEALLAKWAGMHALPRLGEPHEVAAVALLLASDDGAFISGADLLVDGGLCALPRYHD
jgi:NAD(P)-dependent dehydrogenase (short-subunit alcohol dehydrogenase family)